MAIKSGITTTLTVDNGAGTPVNRSPRRLDRLGLFCYAYPPLCHAN